MFSFSGNKTSVLNSLDQSCCCIRERHLSEIKYHKYSPPSIRSYFSFKSLIQLLHYAGSSELVFFVEFKEYQGKKTSFCSLSLFPFVKYLLVFLWNAQWIVLYGGIFVQIQSMLISWPFQMKKTPKLSLICSFGMFHSSLKLKWTVKVSMMIKRKHYYLFLDNKPGELTNLRFILKIQT